MSSQTFPTPQQKEAPCILRGMARNLHLSGLKYKDGFVVEHETFPCCAGSGYRLEKEGVRLCQLHTRLEHLRLLQAQFQAAWPGVNFPLDIPAELRCHSQDWITQFRHGLTTRGFLLQCSKGSHPSPCWTLAAEAIWTYGLPLQVISLGLTPPKALLQALEASPIVIVEQHGSFTLDNTLESFSVILNWCEKTFTPLWLTLHKDTSKGTKSTPVDANPFLNQIHAEIERSYDPLRMLGSYYRSRLKVLLERKFDLG